MIGAHIECDKCGKWQAWENTSLTKGKQLSRRSGWKFGKDKEGRNYTLCPKCKAVKTTKPTRT